MAARFSLESLWEPTPEQKARYSCFCIHLEKKGIDSSEHVTRQLSQYLRLSERKCHGYYEERELPEYTYEDYRKWEGDWELIEGIPYARGPAPVKSHQLIVLEIGRELLSRLEACPN